MNFSIWWQQEENDTFGEKIFTVDLLTLPIIFGGVVKINKDSTHALNK